MQQSPHPIDNIVSVLEANDSKTLMGLFEGAHPADIADALESLTPEKRHLAWTHIPVEARGEVLAELNEGVFKTLTQELHSDELIPAIQQLDIDDIADLIPDLPESILADVLFAVDTETRNHLGEVLAYPEDSAGGLMNLDATVVRDNVTIDVLLRFLRLKDELPKQTGSIYLVNRHNRLTGVLAVERLLTSDLNELAANFIDESPVILEAMDSEDEVAKSFADYDLTSAPVVNEKNELLGRITIDDVVDVIKEQAEHDIMAVAGLPNEADIFAPVATTTKNRTLWLGVNLITALLGSWVIGQFEGSIQQLVALAVLMPIVASMGGNAGTQTLTVVIRGMSMGTITSENAFNVLKKESLVGVFNGLLWAIVISIIAGLWYGSPALGSVIAAAMVANLIMGAIAGVCIPIFLDKVGVDPALAGGVALTTVTDVVGYFSVLGLATMLLL